jgi:predicted permease
MHIFYLLLPVIYLFLGVFIKKYNLFQIDIKNILSTLLTKILIPIVIIYNTANYNSNLGYIVLGTMLIMLILCGIVSIIRFNIFFNSLFQHKSDYLSFFYLNIGWLGLPIAQSLFGEQASNIMLSAYIGSSIFGNTISPSILLFKGINVKNLFNILKLPPVIALFIGFMLIPISDYLYIFNNIYIICKFLLSFLGMLLLGMWLYGYKISLTDLKQSFYFSLLRGLFIAIIIYFCLKVANYYNIELITSNYLTFYLFAFLPPAANIIALESYYLKTGHSAKTIASGTIISFVFILIYAIFISFL